MLPLRPGIPEKRTHDHIRHHTTTLFTAPEAAAGQVTGACYPRHRHQEELPQFPRHAAKACPRRQLHIVTGSHGTRKHPDGTAWPAKNPRITRHHTPTSASWLNMAEIFFAIITRQATRRASFTSVDDLITAIENFTDGWNERCPPLTWIKTPEESIPRPKPVE